MKKLLFTLSLIASAISLNAQDIVDVAVSSKDHSTLVTAVTSADLVATLKSEGPFTVFAPTNAAFDKLPEGTVETLVKPESKKTLTSILTYHVIAGKIDANTVLKAIKKGNGKAVLTTVNGEELTASVVKGKVILTDTKGGTATVTATDLEASNGIIHVIDNVIMP
jgi:uncharacterized surface protein with fasciclin (FAS1) repeats